MHRRQPAPLHNYDKVEIGDVGYLKDGQFHLLFSAGRSCGSRSLGEDVPRNFIPIETQPIFSLQPRSPQILPSQKMSVKDGHVGVSLDM